MGCVANIDYDKFPKQGSWLGKRTRVCFHYQSHRRIMGTVIRDDDEAPHTTLILLDDGRVVNACECQHSPVS
jgi:hypothetical protein